MVSSDTSNAYSGILIQPHVGCVNGRDSLIRCTLWNGHKEDMKQCEPVSGWSVPVLCRFNINAS